MNPIEDFFNNSTVLISGPTGFLGSVLVEKLLRCFEVKKIFMLIRSKNNESVEERLENFLNKEVSLLEFLVSFDSISSITIDFPRAARNQQQSFRET
jgi:thioester reductase-like protein